MYYLQISRILIYFSDGNYIALGSRDNYIYVYQVSDSGRKYGRIGRCSVSKY